MLGSICTTSVPFSKFPMWMWGVKGPQEKLGGTGEKAGWNKYWTQDQGLQSARCFGSQEQTGHGIQRVNWDNESFMAAVAFTPITLFNS